MRKLEIDVHWTPSPWAGGANAPVVCHGRGADEMHAGCTTERLFADTMAPVAAWLRAHPSEVLLLYVEDNLGGTEGQEAAARVLDDVFGKLLYRPRGGASCLAAAPGADPARRAERGRPGRRGQRLRRGARLARRGVRLGRARPTAAPVHVETSTHGYSADCAPGDFPRSTYDTRLVRYYEDSTWVSATLDPGGPGYYDAGVTAQAAQRMTRCGVDLIDFDQILPDDGRLDAVVWSGRGKSRAGRAAIAPHRARTGAGVPVPCRLRLPAACRRADGAWTVSRAPVRFRSAPRRMPSPRRPLRRPPDRLRERTPTRRPRRHCGRRVARPRPPARPLDRARQGADPRPDAETYIRPLLRA